MPKVNDLKQQFCSIFAATPDVVIKAPGRVNLIGDHTDYNDGYVLPVAINFATSIAAKVRSDDIVRVYSKDYSDHISHMSLNDLQYNKSDMWLNYLAGTLKILQQKYSTISGADIYIDGNVPLGVGLSSSASFEVAILKAYSDLYHLELDGVTAALMGQKAENSFVGCNCGIMDQLISALGKEGHAMLLDCQDLSYTDVPIPEELSIIIINSKVKRELVDSEYNIRRFQCDDAANYFQLNSLRDLSLSKLKKSKGKLNPILYSRAKHVVTENVRAQAAKDALVNNDMQLLSSLMRDSHASLRDDYEVSTHEIDFLVAMIDELLGDLGGARMTGGGFGGCVVAILPTQLTDTLANHVISKYTKAFKIIPDVYICKASQGAFRMSASVLAV